MIAFRVWPGEGCEETNIGVCQFPQHVWRADKHDPDMAPAWSMVFDRPKSYPDSLKIITAFLRRWHLRRLPYSRKGVTRNDRFGWIADLIYHGSYATAEIRKGFYRSHRRGYAGDFGLVALRDRMKWEMFAKFTGTADEAKRVFASPEFQSDLNKLVLGETHVTPAARGVFGSFCKTEYSKDFVQCHLAVLALLEHLQTLGFKVEVSDEGGYWTSRNLEELAKRHGESAEALAALAGFFKDAAAGTGLTVEAPITERPDFERLEHAGQKRIANLLAHLRKAM
jgi:hypothetical protein